MTFLKTLIARLNKSSVEAGPKAEVEDIFTARLRKMQGRQRQAAQTTPFKSSRQQQAA
ncbi:hypothetical protein GCM10010991_14100 [Gemmobacter aquaticus]|jgi:hypothetical protein|uniref:Uncharacterized protein n=1 Tax=Gemmobacter aquaticus TaxID=490185 RepID=A0A918DC09_9RHOB|nr:hypothetical protein [Gemmobacter aquaticus]GGO29824.1 hypothetical protein GCM10010991_14100 [Gemmobacter aquaticus]